MGLQSFPFYRQLDAKDCGPTCLQMIAKHYGRNYSLDNLREKCYITREGVSLLGISEAAEGIGFRSMGVRISFKQLRNESPLPCIVHWNQEHFIVVYKVSKEKVYVADPAHGKVIYTYNEFIKCWASTQEQSTPQGICLLLEPTPDFFEQSGDSLDKTSLRFLIKYLRPHKKFIGQLIIGLLAGSILQLIFPFLTQAVVDIGINTQNLRFIWLVLIAQLVLFASSLSVEYIRSWILLHISTRINISIISDFLIKLMKLPIRFFDSKMTGDILQRVEDHSRIERFLTSQSLIFLFSIFNIIVFGIVLAIYSLKIFSIFIIGSALYILWVLAFMKKRRDLDYKRFAQMSNEQSNLIQLITGMQEIKLNHCERKKRWEWERIQARLFKINIKSLSLNQYQHLGALFFNETKNILITIIAATSVLHGSITLGAMLAIQYIIGQLNSPIDQMVNFIHAAQDAKISLERLGEIHNKDDEEITDENKLTELPENKSLSVNALSFQYEGPNSPKVLDNIDLIIPENKTTAIVGTSGSGKTTLLKLVLGFYEPVAGSIEIGANRINNYNQSWWRSNCGVVMQDGILFSDTIANNIAVSDERVDKKQLLYAVQVANIREFIESLPLGYNTRIGQDGIGMSQGQKQRILIARAVYRDPEYIFFDEATNALDANNEKVILENLKNFFRGKTVVVVAHRLSTVKGADQIVVMDKGRIVEAGDHQTLIKNKGEYFNLVKDQLELGG
jgi:ATP-binding cassette, subfamily B, bacterial